MNSADKFNPSPNELNAVVVIGSDSNRNGFVKAGETIPVNKIDTQRTCEDNNTGNKNVQAAGGDRRENSQENNKDFNEPSNVIDREMMEGFCNLVLLYALQNKFLQHVVAFALLILGIEWGPLHNFLENHFILLDITLVASAILKLIWFYKILPRFKFKGRLFLTHLMDVFITVNTFWVFAAFSFNFTVVSTCYCVGLYAATETTTFFFLGILVFFKKATYNGCAIYVYSFIIPVLFLVLAEAYYFQLQYKATEEGEMGIACGDSLKVLTASSEMDFTDTNTTQHDINDEYSMSYFSYFMINVCGAIGLSALFILGTVAEMQCQIKKLKVKLNKHLDSGTMAALAEFEVPEETVQPVDV